ncbi:hypothetical protein [Halovivax limisalsi]|uniref:hypothetical protein n=1 Tax=Halovivax limisalsi TaxID=1453760 RepID=UPI001FFD39BC|nr:hypothetical protein [Halovivax limisalsi]
MSSRASLGEIKSPKASGDAIEADVIQSIDALRYVGDGTATWHDAETTGLLEASTSLPFYGIVVVEPETPIEIKACQVRTSNGSRSTRGRFYVKRRAHQQLVDAAGMYLFAIYVPRPGLPNQARALVPATLVDELLKERWYDVDGERSEQSVAKLAWSHVIDPATVDLSRGDRRVE